MKTFALVCLSVLCAARCAFGAIPGTGAYDTNNFNWNGQKMKLQPKQQFGSVGLTNGGLTVSAPPGSTGFVYFAQADVGNVVADPRNQIGWVDGADNYLPIQAALNASQNVQLPYGTNLIGHALTMRSGQTLRGSGRGTTLLASGDFRVITAWGTTTTALSNIVVQDITIVCTNAAGNNSVGVSMQYVSDATLRNVSVWNPGLNGYEILNCSRILKDQCACYNTGAFGHFFYKSFDCTDYSSYASNTLLWSWEYKDCKRCQNYATRIDYSHDYGVLIFTGFDANLVPGDVLSEDNTFYGLHINQASFTKNAIQIYGSPRNTFYSPVINQIANAWTPIELSASTFYNETGTNIVGTIATGSTNITGVTGGSPIQPGDRIHIGGVSGNFTVYTNTGTTISLTSAVGTGYTNGLIGWVALANETRIINPDITCAGNSDGINVASPGGGDSYKGVLIQGGQIRWAGVNGIRSTGNADLTISGTKIEGSTNNAIFIDSSNVQLDTITAKDGHSDSIFLQNGAHVTASNCVITNSGNVGVYCGALGNTVNWMGGRIESSFTAASILQGGSSVVGARIYNTRWNTTFFRGELWVFGTNNTVSSCVFDPGTSTALDTHIEEQSGASVNCYQANSYLGNLGQNVAYASGSSSANLALDGGVLDYRQIVIHIGNHQLLSTQRGTEFSNEGAPGTITDSLPSAAPGLHYGFIVRSATGWQVNATGGALIRDAGNASTNNGFITSTTLGDYIHMEAINTNEWWITSERGSGWAVH